MNFFAIAVFIVNSGLACSVKTTLPTKTTPISTTTSLTTTTMLTFKITPTTTPTPPIITAPPIITTPPTTTTLPMPTTPPTKTTPPTTSTPPMTMTQPTTTTPPTKTTYPTTTTPQTTTTPPITKATTTTSTPPTTTTPPTTKITPIITTTPGTTAPYCAAEYSCLNCTSVQICAPTPDGKYQETDRFTCPTYAPWCDADTFTCTSVEPPACATEGGFTCMQDGYFPDVEDCSKFYVCEDDVAHAYECSGDTPYYVQYYQSCQVSSFSTSCADRYVNCSGKSGVKVAVSTNASDVFVYCADGKVAAVDKCAAYRSGGYRFNEAAQTCLPTCPHAGLFPDDRDCTKYYLCSPDTDSLGNTGFKMTLDLACPQGQGFSQYSYACVNGSSLPDCDVSGTSEFIV